MVFQGVSLATVSFEDLPLCQKYRALGTSLEKHHRSVNYFVLPSSWPGLVGYSGQANYAAGNTFLGAFVQYRHSLGRHCSAVNTGVVEDVGYVSRNPHLLDHFWAMSPHSCKSISAWIRYSLSLITPCRRTTSRPSGALLLY
ncbi:hypothetical protein BDV10DRAFT_157424 [Aspergillus recurvatus]